MNKSLIIIIILCILAIFIATTNTQAIQSGLNDIKTAIQGEENKAPIAHIINNTTNTTNNSYNINLNNSKTYNQNGIYFQYPNYWNYDQLNKFLSLYKKEYLSRWDDGMIFYISDNPINEELKFQEENEKYKHPKNTTVDGEEAYSLSTTKGDYWHYLVLVEKNTKQTYVITFYCDQELKKQDKVLFDEILSIMKLD